MQKEWNKGAIEVYFEDIENEEFIRRSYPNTIANVTEVQVEGFTEAIESLSDLPLGHTVIVEEYKYTR
ncbi:hypothetical protein JTF06_13540 [Desemzia sp. RIT804]|uniref:DUF1659 domain-containing protein n=1 Tax=Desemzia sp. RIT 804 TaxID=2810209 RepID=UPI00194E28AB|nr:hypothetical protein [Desemzia sp. RIT 804]MBM6615909.1 hypothetical protein [Desemzia sp. RIT 804]